MDPETREFARSHTRTFQPNPDCGPYGGQVIVLTGPQVMSSNESFLMMMRQAGATLFGAPSFGSSGNPKPYELDNGLVLYVPQWQDMDLDGRLVEGNGITPNILLDLAPDRFVADDPVFGGPWSWSVTRQRVPPPARIPGAANRMRKGPDSAGRIPVGRC